MLGMKRYAKDYIAACRAMVDADLRAYRSQVGKAPDFVRLSNPFFAELEKRFG